MTASAAPYSALLPMRIVIQLSHATMSGLLKSVFLLLLVVLAPVTRAAEVADPMTVLYENTLTCQGNESDNWLCYYWFYPGGYFREFQVIRRRDGNMALNGREGSFTVTRSGAETTLCQTLDAGRHTWCRSLTLRQVGDQWQETLANGQTQKFSILKGRLLLNFLSGTGNDPHILSPYKYPDYPPDPSRVMRDIGGAASR